MTHLCPSAFAPVTNLFSCISGSITGDGCSGISSSPKGKSCRVLRVCRHWGCSCPDLRDRTEAFVQTLHTWTFAQFLKDVRSSLACSSNLYAKLHKKFFLKVNLFMFSMYPFTIVVYTQSRHLDEPKRSNHFSRIFCSPFGHW